MKETIVQSLVVLSFVTMAVAQAYTATHSNTIVVPAVSRDLNNDGKVDIIDLSILASEINPSK